MAMRRAVRRATRSTYNDGHRHRQTAVKTEASTRASAQNRTETAVKTAGGVSTNPKDMNLKDLHETYAALTAIGVPCEEYEAEILERSKQAVPSADLDRIRAWADDNAAVTPSIAVTDEADDEPEADPIGNLADRPASMDEIIGQAALIGRLRMVCAGSILRGTKMPDVLLSGPPGFGKTAVAGVIAAELGTKMITTHGDQLRKVSDLTGLLVQIDEPTVVFIDEVHAMSRSCQETLYTAMEDGVIHVMESGGVSTAYDVRGLIVVGATTNPGKLEGPMRDRYGLRLAMSAYTVEELAAIVARRWERKGTTHGETEALEVGHRCKGVPREALHLADRVLDYAAVMTPSGDVTDGTADAALNCFGVNALGLDEKDMEILSLLTSPEYAGKTIGMDSLAQAVSLDWKTLADQHEPYLVRAGFLLREKSGRKASQAAYDLCKAVAA